MIVAAIAHVVLEPIETGTILLVGDLLIDAFVQLPCAVECFLNRSIVGMLERRVLENLLDQQWITCDALDGLGKKAVQRQTTGLVLKGLQRRAKLVAKIALRLQILVRLRAATAVLKVRIGHERQVGAENVADAREIRDGHGRV